MVKAGSGRGVHRRIAKTRLEPGEHRLVIVGPGAQAHRLVDLVGEARKIKLASGRADNLQIGAQQVVAFQKIEGRKQHAKRQVARGSEDHDGAAVVA